MPEENSFSLSDQVDGAARRPDWGDDVEGHVADRGDTEGLVPAPSPEPPALSEEEGVEGHIMTPPDHRSDESAPESEQGGEGMMVC